MTGVWALPALLLALAVRTASAAPVPVDARAVADRIGRSQVRIALKHTDNRGTLIDVHTGDVDQLTVIAVHGFRGQPADLSPLIEQAIGAGHTVKVFAYDDKFRSLDDSSRDLASAIQQWCATHPEAPLRIDAHSMGGRIVLGALARMASEAALMRPIQINLIAVPLAGVESANWARVLPPFLPWVRAWRGLASRAGYQRSLDRLELPVGVDVNVYAGGRDHVFRHSTAQYRALVERLRGRLHVFPGATHMSTVDEVARLH